MKYTFAKLLKFISPSTTMSENLGSRMNSNEDSEFEPLPSRVQIVDIDGQAVSRRKPQESEAFYQEAFLRNLIHVNTRNFQFEHHPDMNNPEDGYSYKVLKMALGEIYISNEPHEITINIKKNKKIPHKKGTCSLIHDYQNHTSQRRHQIVTDSMSDMNEVGYYISQERIIHQSVYQIHLLNTPRCQGDEFYVKCRIYHNMAIPESNELYAVPNNYCRDEDVKLEARNPVLETDFNQQFSYLKVDLYYPNRPEFQGYQDPVCSGYQIACYRHQNVSIWTHDYSNFESMEIRFVLIRSSGRFVNFETQAFQSANIVIDFSDRQNLFNEVKEDAIVLSRSLIEKPIKWDIISKEWLGFKKTFKLPNGEVRTYSGF